MLELARRSLVSASLALWLGGLTFYGAVVIRVASRVLGSHTQVGFVTQAVAPWLNALGAAVLALLVPELARLREAGAARAVRWVAWGVAAASQASLYALKRRLDALLDRPTASILEPERFYGLHQVYLGLTTASWAAGVALGVLLLAAWRRRDRAGA